MSTSRGQQQQQQLYFEQQRAHLVNDIAANLEHVLQNMNLLNRSLESAIAVGNEFGQVEGLWSRFENVMQQQQPAQTQQQGQQHAQGQEQQAGGAGERV
ncbi:hypothetical protein AAFC00_006853 [Neodothiora populina]|uniref:DASH complex subunit DAD1 n=1 Tax=Neodothiora populina TaxID=2781224 RepID=A0ABR3PBN1_9PEZI